MTDEIVKTPTGQTKTKIWMDSLVFIVFLVMMEPRSSGLAVHEWLGLSMLATITVHLLLSWEWIIEITRRFAGRLGLQNRLNYILNWLLFIDGTLLMISGIMISEVALPYLGIKLPIGFAWRRLHDMSANIVLLLLGVHTALHWNWIVNTFSKYLIQPFKNLFSLKAGKDGAK